MKMIFSDEFVKKFVREYGEKLDFGQFDYYADYAISLNKEHAEREIVSFRDHLIERANKDLASILGLTWLLENINKQKDISLDEFKTKPLSFLDLNNREKFTLYEFKTIGAVLEISSDKLLEKRRVGKQCLILLKRAIISKSRHCKIDIESVEDFPLFRSD